MQEGSSAMYGQEKGDHQHGAGSLEGLLLSDDQVLQLCSGQRIQVGAEQGRLHNLVLQARLQVGQVLRVASQLALHILIQDLALHHLYKGQTHLQPIDIANRAAATKD